MSHVSARLEMQNLLGAMLLGDPARTPTGRCAIAARRWPANPASSPLRRRSSGRIRHHRRCSGVCADPFIEAVGVVADQDAPALGLDAVEDDRWRPAAAVVGASSRKLRARSAARRLDVVVRHRSRYRCRDAASRARAARSSLALSLSDSLPLCILRELATIEVPMWPGITTEHLMCGALSRRSVISASVKPFTANFAAL